MTSPQALSETDRRSRRCLGRFEERLLAEPSKVFGYVSLGSSPRLEGARRSTRAAPEHPVWPVPTRIPACLSRFRVFELSPTRFTLGSATPLAPRFSSGSSEGLPSRWYRPAPAAFIRGVILPRRRAAGSRAGTPRSGRVLIKVTQHEPDRALSRLLGGRTPACCLNRITGP